DASLAHAAGKQNLPQAIVDLVRAGVVQLIALQVNLRPAQVLGQARGEIERARAAGVVRVEGRELLVKLRVRLGGGVPGLKVEDQRHQRFGDEAAAVEAEESALVRPGAKRVLRNGCHDAASWANDRALAMNARISSGDFTPGAVSTPEDTSTPEAPEM